MTRKTRAKVYRKAAKDLFKAESPTCGLFNVIDTSCEEIFEELILFKVRVAKEICWRFYKLPVSEQKNVRIIALLLSAEIALNP